MFVRDHAEAVLIAHNLARRVERVCALLLFALVVSWVAIYGLG
jgi:hypothetical protein